MEIKLEFPYCPPSINTYYRRAGTTMYLTKKGRDFKKNMLEYLQNTLGYKRDALEDRLKVCIEIKFKEKRKRDVDNYNKAILDSFNGVVWKDDEIIDELTTRKSYGNKENMIIITVESIKEV